MLFLAWIASLSLLIAGSSPGETADPAPAGIQWFGTLERGLAEAERTGRPIFMTSASLRCEGVPGMW